MTPLIAPAKTCLSNNHENYILMMSQHFVLIGYFTIQMYFNCYIISVQFVWLFLSCRFAGAELVARKTFCLLRLIFRFGSELVTLISDTAVEIVFLFSV